MLDHVISAQTLSVLINSQNERETNKIKIKPIPIIRRSLPNTPKLRIKLRANAYKNFSKLSASGPHALQILDNISKSSSLKMIKKFEFDPYFCESSCIRELRIALQKLKTIKEFCLIIRRLDDSTRANKIQRLGPYFGKLLRLKKLRVEFLRVENVKETHILSVYNALRKCYVLKALEWTVVESPLMSMQYYVAYAAIMKKVQKLESYKDYLTIKNGIINADLYETMHDLPRLPKMPKLKHLEVIYDVAKEWSHIGEDGDLGVELLRSYLCTHVNLESWKCKLIKIPFLSQDTLALFQGLRPLVHLKHVEFELLNCQISDTEFVAFLYGVSQVPQLKSVCLKVIQKSPLSMDYIEKFVEKLSAMENITKFDLYLRKQYIETRDIPQVERMFTRFKNVQCSCSPQSLYIFKTESSSYLSY